MNASIKAMSTSTNNTNNPTPKQRLAQFASDNTAGACPEAWQALTTANQGFAAPYGNDPHTQKASDAIRRVFDADCDVYFCFNGTAANSVSLSHLCQPYHAIIAHRLAHIENDECGGPEFFSHGSKLLLGDGPHGKLTPGSIEAIVKRRTDIHYPKPEVISLTQPTELGTVYTLDELTAISNTAKSLGLKIHLDGARFANAVAALDTAPADIIRAAQADVLCLGGTKNGMPVGEAVVFFHRDLAGDFAYRCKQAGQLASKMRFMSAPWAAMLTDDVWLKHARHANAQAARLSKALQAMDGITLTAPTQINTVYFDGSSEVHRRMQDACVGYYSFLGEGSARLMCSWATTDEDIDLLISVIEGSIVKL